MADDLIFYDYAVPRSKGIKAPDYFLEHRDRIVPIISTGCESSCKAGPLRPC